MPGEMLPLIAPVSSLPRIGPQRASLLARLEIATIHDLLLHAPRRYDDRRHFLRIEEIQSTGPVSTSGEVIDVGVKKFARGRKSVLTVVIDDGTARLHCRWWNMPYLEKNFAKGQQLLVSGRVKEIRPRTIDHPETELLEEEGEEESFPARAIIPVYPLTEGIGQRWLRSRIWETLSNPAVEWFEPLPADVVPYGPNHREAIKALHFPEDLKEPVAARERLALEEFIALQLGIQTRRRNFEAKAPRLACPGDNRLIRRFLPLLGYELTNAQKNALREMRTDLSNGLPMRRLLQGDVGSGKTVVAACTALMVIESGWNAVMMAPTEVLALQHYKTFSGWFGKIGVPVHIWTGSLKSSLEETSLLGPAGPGLVIGTHALVESSFKLDRTGLVIIDEQHKFGVAQREELVRKGAYPHLLVMTATPIPRTLGLTLYGDLDTSVLDELPPGRKPVKTFVRDAAKLPKVWEFVRERLKLGEQAYVVYPRVENDATGKAVLKELVAIEEAVAPFRAAALHGKLKAAEKEQIMTRFRDNELQVIVASSLIEVGLDVPNATIMLIENAEQFGLAQLHQLRGRIGRGGRAAFCILISTARTEEGMERLAVLENCSNGFEIAEADFRFRGPGELLGQGQSGMPNFRFGNLLTDFALIRRAKDIARQLLDRGLAPALRQV